MKHSTLSTPLSRALLTLSLLSTPTLSSILERTGSDPYSCHSNHFPGPLNPSFEEPALKSWTVVSGTAFGPLSYVTSKP